MRQQTKAKVTYGLAVACTQHMFLFADNLTVGGSLEISLFMKPASDTADAVLRPPLFGLSVLQVSLSFAL